ncbi:MAG: 6-phosphogluconolactonase, partial [Acidobacteria bacterium]|nr:6-phosphogluconolactonase [Acidobacteriota bacterium]
HPDSNYRAALEALLRRVPVPPGNVHRIEAGDGDAGEAARRYEEELRAFFRTGTRGMPRFDLVLLGMGEDGHTASLFPGSGALRERVRLVAAPWVEKLDTHRITLTPPALNNAACVIFLVCGAAKAATLREVLEGEYEPDRLPAQIIRPADGMVVWLVDRKAASLLAC